MWKRTVFFRGIFLGFAAGVAFTNLLTIIRGNPLSAITTSFFDETSAHNEIHAKEGLPQSDLERADHHGGTNTSQSAHQLLLRTSSLIVNAVQAQLGTTTILQQPDDTLHSVVESTVTRTMGKQPAVAVVMCVNSRSKRKIVLEQDKKLQSMSIAKLMLPSLQRTMEADKYKYTLFIGMDDTDTFWGTPAVQQELRNQAGPSLSIVFRSIPNKNRIPFNEILKVAYDMNYDYMIRINDDSEFITGNWTSYAIHALDSLDPPNVGVVGPTCFEGNKYILTHDFVHRTHMDIFKGVYYSKAFSNWWLDDWITWSYVPRRMRKLDYWVVKHHIGHHGTRYNVDMKQEKQVESEIQKGKQAVTNWLIDHNHMKETPSMSSQFDILLGIDECTFESFLNWWSHYIQLPDNKISNVYIVAEDQSTYNKLMEPKALKKLKERRAIIDFSPLTTLVNQAPKINVVTKAQRMLAYLGKGRNILYCDVRIIWISDPFDHIPTPQKPIDVYVNVDNERHTDHVPYYDASFMIMWANSFVIKFLVAWDVKMRTAPKTEFTLLFNNMIKDMHTMSSTKRIKILALPFDKFPNGKAYFGNFTKEQREKAVAVHDNYIARNASKQRLVDYGLWEPFAFDS